MWPLFQSVYRLIGPKIPINIGINVRYRNTSCFDVSKVVNE